MRLRPIRYRVLLFMDIILEPESNSEGRSKCGRVAEVGNMANQSGLSYKDSLKGLEYKKPKDQ